VKELEKSIESKDLEMINFVSCMHDMIWVMEKQETQWVKKARLIHMRKFDLIMEMICNYRITKEATNLKGKEVDLTIKGIAKVFKLPSIGIIVGRKEGRKVIT
jgi:hypothetical protein